MASAAALASAAITGGIQGGIAEVSGALPPTLVTWEGIAKSIADEGSGAACSGAATVALRVSSTAADEPTGRILVSSSADGIVSEPIAPAARPPSLPLPATTAAAAAAAAAAGTPLPLPFLPVVPIAATLPILPAVAPMPPLAPSRAPLVSSPFIFAGFKAAWHSATARLVAVLAAAAAPRPLRPLLAAVGTVVR